MSPIPDGNQDGPNNKEDEIADIESPQFNINVDSDSSSSGEDEEHDGPVSMGYQLLPQDPEITSSGDAPNDSHDEGEEVAQSNATATVGSVDTAVKATLDSSAFQGASSMNQQLPVVENAEAVERRTLWNKQNKSTIHTTAMDKADVQTIKAVMANIKLPTPDWAKQIPEDQWQKQLFSRLQDTEQTEHNIHSRNKASSGKCDKKTSSDSKAKSINSKAVSTEGSSSCDQTISSEQIQDNAEHCGQKDMS